MMKTLILYASKTGVSADIAKRLAEKSGADTKDVRDAGITLEPYEEVVLGGAVYATRLIGPLRRFVKKHAEELSQKKLHIFVCGADMETDLHAVVKKDFPNPIYKQAENIVFVGGELRIEKMGFFSRLIIKMVSKSQEDKESPRILDDVVEALAVKLGKT